MRRYVISLAATLAATPILADEADDLNKSFGAVVTALYSTQAHVDACSALHPDRAEEFRDLRAGWHFRRDMDEGERAIAAVAAADPGIPAQLDAAAAEIDASILAAVADDPALCDRLPVIFDEDQQSPPDALRQLRRILRDHGIGLADAPPTPHPLMTPGEIIPLSLLSARLSAVMETVGSAAGGARDRHLREARGAEAERWLEAHDTVIVSGRVVEDDAIREWLGDRQSSFLLQCDDFLTESVEQQFAALMERDVVIQGSVRWVASRAEGGVVELDDCAILADPADWPVAQGDATSGTMLRPLSEAEAYAGPGAGIRPGDVAHLLYDAQFDFRVDGFGNSYTDRQEDIYVLLKDGTAWRHDRGFAFTDLDVDLARAREPGNWFTWAAAGDGFELTAADGDAVTITGAQALQPMPEGARLDDRYYFQQIGMGGRRTDRSYVFAQDGTVTHARGGFVAGNVGTSYITVVGPSGEPVRSGYRFEGYSLILDTPDGEIRHFAAIPVSADASRPDTILIGGRAYWLED